MLAGGLAIQGPAWAAAVPALAAVGMWPLNGTLNDISGNGLHLTEERGAVTYGQVDPSFAGIGTGFAYDSSRNQIAPTSAFLRIVGDLTIAFLFNPNSTALMTYVQCESAARLDYAFYNSSGGLGNVDGSYAGPTSINHDIGHPGPKGIIGRANHLAMRRTVSGGSFLVEAWVNGVQWPGSVPSATLPTSDGLERMRVGGFSGGSNLVGTMAQLRVWSAALTDVQIKADYNALLGPYYGFV